MSIDALLAGHAKDLGFLVLPPLAEELALHGVQDALAVDGDALVVCTLAILAPGKALRISATAPARFMELGGDALDGYRCLWWNFVSSRKERIVQAGDDWLAQTMGQVARRP